MSLNALETLDRGQPTNFLELHHPDLHGAFIYPRSDDVGRSAVYITAHILRMRPDAHICCATGQTQKPFFQIMRLMYYQNLYDPSRALWSHLDERAGLDPTDPESFAGELYRELWYPLQVPLGRRFAIQGNAPPEIEIPRLQEFLRHHPRTLTITGLGEDDHLAFIMPNDPLYERAHYVPRLSEHVITRDQQRTGRMLPSAFTMGLCDITETELLLMLVTGRAKAQAVKRMLTNEIGPSTPSAFIRSQGNAIVLMDAEAAAEIV